MSGMLPHITHAFPNSWLAGLTKIWGASPCGIDRVDLIEVKPQQEVMLRPHAATQTEGLLRSLTAGDRPSWPTWRDRSRRKFENTQGCCDRGYALFPPYSRDPLVASRIGSGRSSGTRACGSPQIRCSHAWTEPCAIRLYMIRRFAFRGGRKPGSQREWCSSS